MRHLAMTMRTRVGRLSPRLGTPSGRPGVRLRGAVLLMAALAMLAPLVLTGADDAQPVGIAAPTRTNPDVVVILTDDQRTDTLMSMPSVRRLLVDQGTRFSEAHVPNSLCCPSRSTILTGLYSHDNGVWVNYGANGGWRAFVKHGDENRTIALNLQRAGYRTALIGKYLNQFGKEAPLGYKPVGWNDFQAFWVEATSGAYYNYRLNSPKLYGESASDYSTDVLAHKAVNFIWSTPRDKSLFLYFAPFAPHFPWLPAPRDRGALKGKLPTYRPASSTASLADKPVYLHGRRVIPQEKIDRAREGQGESLIAVDDAVSALVAALEHSGRLRDTMIVFMSDNGYLDGDHRIFGKNVPYQEATSVPLVIRWDGRVRRGVVDNRMTGNIDIAATIADAAGITMKTDGQSLLGDQRRSGILLEAGYSSKLLRPPYCGWRDPDWLFVHYSTGEEELYSVPDDPQELHNLASDPAQASVLASLRAQAKRACKPMPPDFHW